MTRASVNPERGAGDLFAERARRRNAPIAVLIQVTARCNYQCVHCYEVHDESKELPLATIERILDEVAAEGTLFLTLTGGEFFLRRDADDILAAARKRKFAVKLLTTGHFVDERRARLIHDLGAIQVDLSFYSADPHVHEAITQMPRSHERTLAAARRLRALGVPVVLKSPVMAPNAAGVGELAKLARANDCAFQLDPKVTGREDGDAGPTALRMSDDALRAFYADEETGVFQNLVASHANALAGRDKPLDSTPCRAGLDIAAVDPTGLMYACHSLKIPVGDLRTQSFGEIWRHSLELTRIRNLTWARIEECNTCDVRAYCTRCHAMAHLEDGKVDGPSREACRHAVVIRDLLADKGLIPDGDRALPPGMRAVRVRPPALRVLG